MTVRWAGMNPLFECPWLKSEVPIRELTGDLRAKGAGHGAREVWRDLRRCV